MIRTERRRLTDTGVLGLLLTTIVAALQAGGMLSAPERYLYDLRARHCQLFTPAPTAELVHLDIDDRTLEVIGTWPWPRSILAEIVDEIRLAGTRVLGMDLLFLETQAPGYEEVRDPIWRGPGATRPAMASADTAVLVQARRIDHDAIFAAALKRFGRAIVPLSLNLRVRPPPLAVFRAMVAELSRDIDLGRERLYQQLIGRGLSAADVAEAIADYYTLARQEAMYQRIAAESPAGEADLPALRARILPRLDRQITGSPSLRLLEEQYRRHRAVQVIRQKGRTIDQGLPPLLSAWQEMVPAPVLAEASCLPAFVDYVPEEDGVVRTVPLWAEHRGWIYPHLGLALACAMFDVDIRQVELRADAVVIPHAKGRTVIPVRRVATPHGRFGMFLDIPWFGSENWETMYDYPGYRAKRQHIPVLYVWEACEVRRRIAVNNRTIDQAILNMLGLLESGHSRADAYRASVENELDCATRRSMAEKTLRELDERRWLSLYDRWRDEELSPEDRTQRDLLIGSVKVLRDVPRINEDLQANLQARRSDLRSKLDGKAALLGWVALGAIADVVPTSLHTRCPGVVVHGAVFNAIMQGEFWRRIPGWAGLLVTVAVGLTTTATVAMFSPWRALAATLALAFGYALFNGLYLFDRQNLIVPLAGPLTAAAAVWAAGTMARYVLETSLRARVTRRFRSYVDPSLVQYVMESDEPLDGQVKELTVVFTDLAGFTSLTERLGERTVPLLNRYMGLMVPIIRARHGYLNKFLGDGIMYFFGAPVANDAHAYDAVASVLEMLEAMQPFNRSLAAEGLPELEVRAGIASGNMVVGDAGPADRSASDYTVLGDTVNLGARLEPANKFFGTRILLNARARELVGDSVLVRPVGKIKVLGKKEGVMTFEALALREKATEQQRMLADMTSSVVLAYIDGAFAQALEAAGRLEQVFGPSRLSSLYRQLCENCLREEPADFDGQIVLSTK